MKTAPTPPNKRLTVKTYWLPEEKAAGIAKADKLGLSLSEFVRRLALGTPLPRPGNAEQVRDLLKVNADLARLGNLLKLALDEEQSIAVLKLADEIQTTQALLKQKIRSLK